MFRLRRHRQSVTRRFLVVAHEEKISNHRGWVPRFAIQCLEFRKLATLGRHRIEQNHLAVLSDDEEHIAEKNKLAVAITAILPLQFARCEIEIGEDARRGSIFQITLLDQPAKQWLARTAFSFPRASKRLSYFLLPSPQRLNCLIPPPI